MIMHRTGHTQTNIHIVTIPYEKHKAMHLFTSTWVNRGMATTFWMAVVNEVDGMSTHT